MVLDPRGDVKVPDPADDDVHVLEDDGVLHDDTLLDVDDPHHVPRRRAAHVPPGLPAMPPGEVVEATSLSLSRDVDAGLRGGGTGNAPLRLRSLPGVGVSPLDPRDARGPTRGPRSFKQDRRYPVHTWGPGPLCRDRCGPHPTRVSERWSRPVVRLCMLLVTLLDPLRKRVGRVTRCST